ncbi:MAG: hypothetical protein NTZ67_06345 [Gammaproteobacteria bacterium]|nr:hypothetical protein [Gammaproteobacteria bacterium]
MSDEKKVTPADDDYQFPQGEYVASDSEGHASQNDQTPDEKESTGAPETRQGLGARLRQFHLPQMKNKRLLIAVGVVIFLIVFVRIINSGSTNPKSPVKQPIAEAVLTTPVEQPTDTAALNSLDSLSADSSDTKSKLKDLQSKVADLQSSFNQAQTSNQTLQTTVTQLANQINELSTQLNSAMAKLQAAKTGKKLMVFHLRAVVPDRAWITSDTGETRSVTVGDHIEQYGAVQTIDAQSGLITTSSGRKIEYGGNDY